MIRTIANILVKPYAPQIDPSDLPDIRPLKPATLRPNVVTVNGAVRPLKGTGHILRHETGDDFTSATKVSAADAFGDKSPIVTQRDLDELAKRGHTGEYVQDKAEGLKPSWAAGQTVAQTVRDFRHKSGYGERTVKDYFASFTAAFNHSPIGAVGEWTIV